jgi:hypothetical protein
MSRSGYCDDGDGGQWQFIRWRGMVASAARGKRGQAFFKDMLAALDEMPIKRLIAEELVHEGEVCALGALAQRRGIDVTDIDPENSLVVAGAFNIAEPLAQETVFMNDEAGSYKETPEDRFARVRAWVARQIKDAPTTTGAAA